MQTMQPKIQALREKYKGDRAELQRQMMALQQEQGFNPLAGCLPMFLQIPIFIALYHMLRHIANSPAAVRTAGRSAYDRSPADDLQLHPDADLQRVPGAAVRQRRQQRRAAGRPAARQRRT